MNDKDGLRGQVFSRRAALLSLAGVATFGGLSARLFTLQVTNGERYRMLAENNRIDRRLIAPRRGTIYDRFGVELAKNVQNFRIMLVPEQAGHVEETLDRLAGTIELGEAARRRIRRDIARNRAFVPILIAENLDWETFAYLNANGLDFPGIQPDVGDTRVYPYPEVLSHVVGFVGPVAENDKGTEPELRIPGFRIGKDGVELAFEPQLRGHAGGRDVEVDASGRLIREIRSEAGEQGADLVLTLDLGLQKFAADRVAGESAAIVVMDVATGELVALVSQPGFDSNLFNRGVDIETYRGWQNDPYQPLYNKATKGLFPPGSTFKVVTALAALESGSMRPEEGVYCGGAIQLGDAVFHCWRKEGHGSVDLHRGIKESCDVYFYEAARRTGIDKMSEVAMRLGLGTDYGFALPYTKAGRVPTKEYKLSHFKSAWQTYDSLNTGIGQGFLQVSPLQLATMTARIANGGFAVVPRLVRSVGGVTHDHSEAASIGAEHAYLDRILRAMTAVVNEPRGTALGSRLTGPGLSMGGKTGTAQVRRITRAERATGVLKNDELPWESRDHALFCGFGPTDAPRYSIAVVVEHGGGGSSAAAPVARDVMREALTRDPARRPTFSPMAAAGPATALALKDGR
ncbi:MAG: penicillin-binding protein 2 [Alphaproteobacteria bacterium]|nr:penicillin-binding protein 2 [Alphaproteobacteria bacterium]